MSADLKPCPFCGGIGRLTESAKGWWVIECVNSRCPVGPMTGVRLEPSKAAQDWNKRVTP